MGIIKKRKRAKAGSKQFFSIHLQVRVMLIIDLVKNHRTTIYRTTIHLLYVNTTQFLK